MYFVTPSNSNIFLMFGNHDLHFFGMGEKDGKLCIYQRSIFDIGHWKEFYVTDIDAARTECCENGLHVAHGLYDNDTILLATREKEFTRIFSLHIDSKKFIRYKMLDEANPEIALLNLNLCCKCLSPIIRRENLDLFNIIPEKYQNNVGVFRYFLSVNQSEQFCFLWKENDFLILQKPPVLSNILINENGEVLSVIKKSTEDGKIETFSTESHDAQLDTSIAFEDGNSFRIWHEIAFSPINRKCLTRRKEGDKSFLHLYDVVGFSLSPAAIKFHLLDHYVVDEKFPSLESIHFSVKFREVDKEYVPKRSNKLILEKFDVHLIPSFIFFQCPNGDTVSIPLEVLSLSQLAYLALSRIPQPLPQQQRPLPVAKITIYDYIFGAFRNCFGKRNESSKKEIVSKKKIINHPWMSLNYIKALIGWPNILPLIKEPVLPCSSDK